MRQRLHPRRPPVVDDPTSRVPQQSKTSNGPEIIGAVFVCVSLFRLRQQSSLRGTLFENHPGVSDYRAGVARDIG
jgi:hypothetical protein